MGILEGIRSPADVKALRQSDLPALAAQMRSLITEVVGKNGGHLASNLGVVEIAIALHRVFDCPSDAIVWDVGHQCYAHKLLTGRTDRFPTLRQKDGISGFPRRSESPYDAFDTGHSSTSISAALGILEAKRRRGEGGKAIAVIGDGALTGGMAQEALSHAGHLGRDLIIVLNDNKMSISANVGAFSRYLSRLTATRGYQRFRGKVDRILASVPRFGGRLLRLVERVKSSAKAAFFGMNFFSELGFEYVGPLDGHNVKALSAVFAEVAGNGRPTVVHVVTRKGKGYLLAEDNPAAYHGVSPVRIVDGKVETRPAVTYTEAFSDALMRAAAADARIVAVTAAMAKGTGLSAFQARWPERFYDVGIAEQHAVTFAAGMASAGLKPVVAIYSTFAQRAYDQILHDVALQGLPVVLCMDRAGPVGEDGETHQGVYDIAFLRPVPNLALLAPASAADLGLCLEWALASGRPAAIRYPKCPVPAEHPALSSPVEEGRGIYLRKGKGECLLVSMGGLTAVGEDALDELAQEGILCDHYSLRFLKPLDEDAFVRAVSGHSQLLVVEEGVGPGGAGEALGALLSRRSPGTAVETLAFPDAVYPQMSRAELLEEAGLSCAGIASAIRELVREKRIFRVVAGAEG